MLAVPLPGNGCFEAKPPSETWNSVKCKPAPKAPTPLALKVSPSINVGAGNTYVARLTGTLSSATGSFDSANGITALYSPIFQDTSKTAYPNTYTLQINANMFPTNATTACTSVGCRGWEQFVFSQRSACGGSPCVYIEYWLFDTPSCPINGAQKKGCACPAGPWIAYYDPSGLTGSGCFFNTAATSNFAAPSIADLGKLKFTGQANSNGSDIVTLQTADGVLHVKNYPATTLNLSQSWTEAEFNIFGDCCAYPMFFNTGSSLAVRLSTGSTAAPKCIQYPVYLPPPAVSLYFSGATAETNNLSLVAGSCVEQVGPPQAIVFSESGGGDPTAAGYGIGDPHLATLYGVHYDFQAFGDFVLLEAGQDFIVQTRHKPISAGVSVNTAVATKMGDTRVAICLPGGLEINGKPTTLADGKAAAYGKVLISRNANVYEITGPGAATVRAETTPNLINVYVNAGAIKREAIRGLLGSETGHALDLAMRDGTVLPNPPSYAEFTRYADSWRVQPKESLLCQTGAVPPGMPPRPTSASNLSSQERERVQAICTKAGVKSGPLLEDCMLDVSVLGNKSWVTAPFVSALMPVKEITPTYP